MAQDFTVIMVDGGFCSQLVKYALGEFLKRSRNVKVKYDVAWFANNGMDCDGKNKRELQINKVFPNLDFEIATDDEIATAKRNNHFSNSNPYKFCSELFNQKMPAYIDGYYENIVYMDTVRNVLLKNLDFSKCKLDENNEKILSKIRSAEYSCAVHVRRGDFVNLGLAFLTPGYYSGAIKTVQKKYPKTKFFFFSNDIDYVRQEIIPLCNDIEYTIVDVNNNDTGYLDLYLISQCNAQISSNSSFGFWGAFLNQNNNKMYVLPSRWLPNSKDEVGLYASVAHYLPNAVLLDMNGKLLPRGELNQDLVFDIRKIYDTNNNYLIENVKNKKSNICAIYFSSNGIFYPKTDEVFQKTIIQNDRYEWYKTRYKNACKHIFIRDINMCWYQYGINKYWNSVDKMCDFLRRETRGYEVVCVGSSAGAYAAVLFAHLLGAKRCLVSSMCFDVKNTILLNQTYIPNSEYNAEKYQNYINNVCKYNNITELVRNSACDIYAIFPEYSQIDKPEYDIATNIKNIKILKYVSDVHGQPFSNAMIKVLLNLPTYTLDRIFNGKLYASESEIAVYIPLKYKLLYAFYTLNPRNKIRKYFDVRFWYRMLKILIKQEGKK